MDARSLCLSWGSGIQSGTVRLQLLCRSMAGLSMIVGVLLTGSLLGQSPNPQPAGPPHEALARWQAMRFGLFIHWGPVSLRGTEIGWSRGREVPIADYDQLYQRFNPTLFDADEWVTVAKSAGARYMVITSKHHDGFCLWDSQYTDYDMATTPFRRDILRELSAACHKQDLLFCTYHSICDWHHPDYPLGSPGGKSAKPHPNMSRYVNYLHNQTEEIIRRYGPIGIMWFDGEWESPWTHELAVGLYQHLRSLQPDLLINNRVDKGRRGMEGTTSPGGFLGDYATPEQQVGGFDRQAPWESCITLGRQWAWKPDDELKSLRECVRTLLQTVGGDGNLLLNVGPMPDGRIEPRQVERLQEIGEWLKRYGDTVYGTRGGPFKPGMWGASTCKGSKIFVFVTEWPVDRTLHLPALGAQLLSYRNLSPHQVSLTHTDTDLIVKFAEPDSLDDPIATVLELTVEGPAIDIPPVALAE